MQESPDAGALLLNGVGFLPSSISTSNPSASKTTYSWPCCSSKSKISKSPKYGLSGSNYINKWLGLWHLL